MEILLPYQTAATIVFPLVDFGATDYESTPVTFAAGDTQVMKDEGTFANATNTPAHEGNGFYSLALTATEMQAARIVVTLIDQTDPKAWEDQSVVIRTFGNASSDIDYFPADAVQISGSSSAADNVESVFTGTGDTDDVDLVARKLKLNGDVDYGLEVISSASWAAQITGGMAITSSNGATPALRVQNTANDGIHIEGSAAGAAAVQFTHGSGGSALEFNTGTPSDSPIAADLQEIDSDGDKLSRFAAAVTAIEEGSATGTPTTTVVDTDLVVPEGALPTIGVYALDESTEDESFGTGGPQRVRRLEVLLEITASGASGLAVQDALDDLLEACEAAAATGRGPKQSGGLHHPGRGSPVHALVDARCGADAARWNGRRRARRRLARWHVPPPRSVCRRAPAALGGLPGRRAADRRARRQSGGARPRRRGAVVHGGRGRRARMTTPLNTPDAATALDHAVITATNAIRDVLRAPCADCGHPWALHRTHLEPPGGCGEHGCSCTESLPSVALPTITDAPPFSIGMGTAGSDIAISDHPADSWRIRDDGAFTIGDAPRVMLTDDQVHGVTTMLIEGRHITSVTTFCGALAQPNVDELLPISTLLTCQRCIDELSTTTVRAKL